MFYENDMCEPSHHNRPFYVTAKVKDVEIKGAMLDQGSFFNIISLLVLDAVGVSQETITR